MKRSKKREKMSEGHPDAGADEERDTDLGVEWSGTHLERTSGIYRGPPLRGHR